MTDRKEPVPIALWNPLWTVIWSFIFSPVYGTFLQRRNWLEMGDDYEAEKSRSWLYYSLFVLAVLLFGEPFIPEEAPLADYWFIFIWTVWFLVWAYVNGAIQIRAVNKKYGKNYHHKLWGRSFLLGVAGLLLWMAFSLAYIICLLIAGVIQVAPTP